MYNGENIMTKWQVGMWGKIKKTGQQNEECDLELGESQASIFKIYQINIFVF